MQEAVLGAGDIIVIKGIKKIRDVKAIERQNKYST